MSPQLTPFEKRKQLSNAFVTVVCEEIPVLKALTGIERQLLETYTQAAMNQYGEYIIDVLGIRAK